MTRKFEEHGGNQQVSSDTEDSKFYSELDEILFYLGFHPIRSLLRLLPLDRCSCLYGSIWFHPVILRPLRTIPSESIPNQPLIRTERNNCTLAGETRLSDLIIPRNPSGSNSGWLKNRPHNSNQRRTDVFITKSNSYLLSGELMTNLTGRYVEIGLFTLSFSEYLEMRTPRQATSPRGPALPQLPALRRLPQGPGVRRRPGQGALHRAPREGEAAPPMRPLRHEVEAVLAGRREVPPRRHGHLLRPQRELHHGLRTPTREHGLHVPEVQGLPRERRADRQAGGRLHRTQSRRGVRLHTGVPVGCGKSRREARVPAVFAGTRQLPSVPPYARPAAAGARRRHVPKPRRAHGIRQRAVGTF